MRRIGRRAEPYKAATVKQGASVNKWQRIWAETNIKAREWERTHKRHGMSAIMWNALWERVRDEIFGESWACESDREFAQKREVAI